MNVAVAQIITAAPVDALPFGLAPGRGGSDFIDGRRHGVPGLSLRRLGFFPEMAGVAADRKGGSPQTQGRHVTRGAKICAKPRNEVIIPSRTTDFRWRSIPGHRAFCPT